MIKGVKIINASKVKKIPDFDKGYVDMILNLDENRPVTISEKVAQLNELNGIIMSSLDKTKTNTRELMMQIVSLQAFEFFLLEIFFDQIEDYDVFKKINQINPKNMKYFNRKMQELVKETSKD